MLNYEDDTIPIYLSSVVTETDSMLSLLSSLYREEGKKKRKTKSTKVQGQSFLFKGVVLSGFELTHVQQSQDQKPEALTTTPHCSTIHGVEDTLW